MKTSLRMPCSFLRFLITFSALGIVLPSAHSQISFFTPPTYSGGSLGSFVADFNGDGKLDILSSSGVLNLGNGDGTFTAGTPITGVVLAVADFNGDGKPDVLEQGTGTLLVLLGNGDGTFQAPISTNSGASLSPVVAGDVSGDGKADVLGLYNNNVVVYLSNGDGTFAAGVPYAVGISSAYLETLTLGDFNGDQKPDVAISLSGNNVAGQQVVLLGNGDGTFQTPGKISTGAIFPQSVVAGDFNNDGKLDLAISGEQTDILLGNGDGTFQAPTTIASNSGTLAVGDLNNDGKLDLVLVNSLIEVYLGNGDGTFSTGQTYDPSSLLQAGFEDIVLGDFNHDGKLDVAAAGDVLLGNGDGTLRGWQAAVLSASNGPAKALKRAIKNAKPEAAAVPPVNSKSVTAVGDFDKNGTTDVAVLSGTSVYILLNNGSGVLSLAHTYSVQVNEEPGGATIAAADVNNDGKLDLVVLSSQPVTFAWNYSVLLGNGDGSFQSPIFTQGTEMAGNAATVVIADFNGDGKLDLALPGGNNSFFVVLGNGDGTFGAPTYFYDNGNDSIVSADFNNDGKLDIAGAGDGLALLLGNGNGTFQTATLFSAPVGGGLLTADLNGDGNADLLNSPYVWLGNGNGTFTAVTGAFPEPLGVSGLADINGDGKPDAFGEVEVNNGVGAGIALGNGDGTFGPYIAVLPPKGATPQTRSVLIEQAVDMNGDGKPDLIVLDANANAIFVLVNTTVSVPGASFAPASLTFPSQTVGSSSSSSPIVLSNSGAVALTVSGVSISGANAGEFTQTNNCATVQPLATCTINVTFTPTAAGAAAANLVVADNAGSGSQTIAIAGTGVAAPSFTLGVPSGGSSSSTIPAGQTATFNLALTPTGSFTGTVNFTCAVTPKVSPAPVCNVPATVSVTGSSATSVMVTVSTTAPGSASGGLSLHSPFGGGLMALGLSMGVSLLLFAGRRRRVVACGLGTVLLAVAFGTMVGCGGGGPSTKTTGTTGTPAGTYTATVTATSGSLSQQMPLTVIVQ